MSSNSLFYILGIIVGFVCCLILWWIIKVDSIKTYSPITPTIEIHIQPDGTRDTTFIYTE
jgi:hypothetical protein